MTAPLGADPVGNALDRWIRAVLLPGARLTLWVLSYLSLLLVGWVLLGMTVGQWSPVVVTSGSMEPAVSVGDVLLIDTTPDDTISQRSIVVFERSDGAVVAHRVFSAEGAELVTKGDANPSPDSERVAVADVRGVARVLVSLVGLPAVWSDQGAWAPLIAWGLLTVAGAVHSIYSLLVSARRREPGRTRDDDIGQVGIRRVRILVAVLIAAQFVLDPTRFEIFGNDRFQLPLLVGLLAVLFVTNALSLRLRTERSRRRLPMIELVVDTSLVVFLSALTGSSGLGWVLFALPIIEAAVRFGLVGALNHWMALTSITVATRIWTFEISGSIDLLEELEKTLDQMSLLFLVVVPGAYLAEQLIGDVAEQRRAITRVVARSELLEAVAEASRSVSQLDGRHIDAVLEGTRQLGFDAVDLVATGDGRTWRRFGGAEEGQLPMPGRIASGVRPADLEHLAVMVDGDDAEERAALDDHGLSALVTSAVAVKDESRAVLRAAIRHGRTITAGEIDAFQLLAGQAAVALQNHELLSEITSMHVELEHQAHHDSLTGLPNRAMFLEQLDDAVRDDVRPAVMFLDLDGFKPVNDRLGHDAGDLLLQLVAKRLERAAPAIPPWLGSAATSSRSSSEEPSATSGPERSRPRSSR
jgi:signal peptidase I